jgi:2-dehydropantoate 2-reductase
MKIGIVGAGAIGLYYGARLQRLGEDVLFLLRSDFDAISKNGIRVRASDGNFRLEKVKGVQNSSEMGVVDLVIVGLKATANADLGGLLAPIVGAETSILNLQNGLGGDELLAKLFPDNPVLAGLCFTCLNRVDPGVVENYLLGSVAIGERGGPASGKTRQIGEMFNRSGANCRVTDDLRLMQWKKLVWNVPFNGLSIVAGEISTDVIVSDEGLSRLARGLMEEIIAVAAAIGMEIESDFIDEQFALTRSMGEYKPSSLVDYLAGRTVEVGAIWGEPLRLGIEAGLDLPKLETLYRLLLLACESRSADC